jgi:hypothetical protein
MGFVLSREEAEELMLQNPANQAVLFPYLTGEDLNSRPDQSPSRWVINFKDWPLRRAEEKEWRRAREEGQKELIRRGIVAPDYSEPVAADYPDCLGIVEQRVKPERAKLANGDATARDRARRWWQFARPTRKLYETISGMERVLVRSRHSNIHSIAFVPTGTVFSEATVVLAFDDCARFALLQSAFHTEWLTTYGSSIRTDVRYTPSDCFETFPFPKLVNTLESIGSSYYSCRQSILVGNQEGLTKIYSRFHDPDEPVVDIQRLREQRTEMDRQVAAIYGWTDLDLGHDFHETKQGIRFTISETARREVLDRLLALNHERHKEEVAEGLHENSTKKTKASGNKKRKKKDDSTITMSF